MTMKTIFILILFLWIKFSVFSQDLLILRNGDEIKVKVTLVGVEDISYKRYDNLQGPTYSIKIWEIYKIKYENGTEEVFTQHKKPDEKTEYTESYFPVKPKPTKFKEKGFINISKFSFGTDIFRLAQFNHNRNMPKVLISTINGFQFNKNAVAGFGLGFGNPLHQGATIPVFGDMHYFFSNKRFSPYILSDLGGLFIAMGEDSEFLPFLKMGGGIKYYINEKLAWVFDFTFYIRGPQNIEKGIGRGIFLSTGISF